MLLQFGREVVLGVTTRYALRRAQPRCDMHAVHPSAKTSSTNTEHRRRPADVAAAYSEPNEQTLDAWRGETNQWEAIVTDRGATE